MVFVFVAIGIVVLLVIARLVWRLRNEQLEPGGSWGEQISGPTEDEKPDDA
jgi:cytochrome b561